ncbi:MAG: ACT domain-containing protein [Desulfobacterales bacterium]|nr:ACT domain-containing protein [Desulfobacterales bacterium]
MKVEQIAVFLENRSGRLADISQTLADHDINIRALSLADTADFGILRLVVDDPARARRILKENGFTVAVAEVVAVEVVDRPGGLGAVLQVIKQAGLNVEYMYAVITHGKDKALLIFRFDELDRAINALLKADIRILSADEVYSV